MKNIFKLFFLSLIGFVFTACDDYVDFDPHDEYYLTEADYLKTEDDYNTMAVSCYTPLQWMNQLMVIGDIASDNAVTGGENANDVLGLQHIDQFQTQTNNQYLEELWTVCYEGINRVNYLYQYKDKNIAGETVEFANKESLYGELYFLRAYYYFNLTRLFGDVVLFTDRKLGVSDFGTLQRSPKAEVYAQIEKDLLAAINVLPTTASQPGRVTKYAAQALLGKVYLYEEKFDEAAQILEPVVNGPFTLVNDFDSIFLYSGENGPESVFEIQYSNGSPYWNWGGATRGQGNYAVQQCGIRGLSGTDDMPYAAGWSTNLPTQELADSYEEGDQRKDATCFNIEEYKNANPQFDITYTVAPYKNTGLYNKKYLPRKGETSGQPELNYENNQRIIRYADVLLMAAEANNRKSSPNDGLAVTYLNRVRYRAFQDNDHNVNLSGQALTKAIWKERRLELAMEGDRFFDLVRTGQASTILTASPASGGFPAYSAFVVGVNEVFPIPQREIDISHITQNNGY